MSDSESEEMTFEIVSVGNFKFLDSEVIWRASECEEKYFVITKYRGEEVLNQTFTDRHEANAVFSSEVHHLLYMATGSDISLYIQQRAEVVEQPKEDKHV